MQRLLPSLFMFVCLFTVAPSTQDKNWKSKLTETLKEAYPNVKTATWERNNITQPGIVLVVRKPNIMGENVHNSVYRISTVENGTVSAPRGLAGFLSSGSAKELPVNERVYVRDIDVADDAIRFQLLTLEMYDLVEKGSTKRTRLVASLAFKFSRVDLPAMSVADIKTAVDAVLGIETAGGPGATKTISLGQTMAQVESILGKPETVINLGAKVTYVYKTLKVIFIDGKVTDVQ